MSNKHVCKEKQRINDIKESCLNFRILLVIPQIKQAFHFPLLKKMFLLI